MPPSAKNSRTSHSRLAADVALDSMAISRPRSKVEDMKTGPERSGPSMMTWLMLQVPAMMEAAPVRVTPEPMAEATTSKRPPTTGVPAARPVCAAASAVTVPTTSALSARSGNRPVASPRSKAAIRSRS
ncbi:hypothetical protein D3C72_1720370 [compost metagenome]